MPNFTPSVQCIALVWQKNFKSNLILPHCVAHNAIGKNDRKVTIHNRTVSKCQCTLGQCYI